MKFYSETHNLGFVCGGVNMRKDPYSSVPSQG